MLNKPPQINFKPQKNFPNGNFSLFAPFFLTTDQSLAIVYWLLTFLLKPHLHFCLNSKFRARFRIWDSQIAQKNGKCFAIMYVLWMKVLIHIIIWNEKIY